MKKLFILLLIGFTAPGSAQTENALLWKISGNGLAEDSYLFGTIHALPEDRSGINDSVRKYLGLSATLVLEINPDIPVKEQLSLAGRMILPDGKVIKDYMDSADYALLYTYLRDSMGIKESKLRKYMQLKPAFMESMILMEIVPDAVNFEKELYAMAKDKHFVALETLTEQLDILDAIPFEDQLAYTGDSYKADKEFYKLMDLYLAADLRGIESEMFDDPDFQTMEYDFLTKRNLKWIPLIRETISAEASFIAVGCAHLIGEDGLLNLLRREGFELSPVFTDK